MILAFIIQLEINSILTAFLKDIQVLSKSLNNNNIIILNLITLTLFIQVFIIWTAQLFISMN